MAIKQDYVFTRGGESEVLRHAPAGCGGAGIGGVLGLGQGLSEAAGELGCFMSRRGSGDSTLWRARFGTSGLARRSGAEAGSGA